MRFISVWLPYWPVESRRAVKGWGAANPADPLVVVSERASARRVQAVNRAAAALGLRPAMMLAEAEALVPSLRTLPADPDGDRRRLRRLAEWCGRYSPWVGVEKGVGIEGVGVAEDGLCLDVSGCGHLFGDAQDLLNDLLRRLRGFGLSARAALAPTPTAAWALARYGASDRAAVIVAAGDLKAGLAPLPVAALQFDQDAAGGLGRRLDGLGLSRIADLYPLPRGALVRRFGAKFLERLDKALGVMSDPMTVLAAAPAFRLRLDFAEPIGRAPDIEMALKRMLEKLCAWLEQERQGARRLDLGLYRVDGEVMTRAIGTAQPVREGLHLFRLFAEKLADLDPGFGVETMILAATRTEALASGQRDLVLDGVPSGEDGGASLAALIDTLAARLGPNQVLKLCPADSHIPERAATLQPATLQPVCAASSSIPAAWLHGAPRPVRLLPCPEPIEVMAGAADTLPAAFFPAAFSWRRVRHVIVRAEGPERIAPEWWRQRGGSATNFTRDYWRVEDADGRRFWLYRASLPEKPAPEKPAPPRWYLHGLFA
jgi:protein ImuB